MAAALSPVLIHDAVGQPPGLRAACGEGSAARALLLDFMPLRFGLLRLRSVSRSALALVAECNLSTQIAAGQVRVLRKPKAALAMVEAFPRAASVKICIDKEWTLQDFGACIHCPTLDVSVHKEWAANPTFSGLSLLQRLRNVKSVQLISDGLTGASFRQLSGTTSLALTVPSHNRSLSFSAASLVLARPLRELSLHNFGDRVTHADLAPLAHQLTKLTLDDCPSVTDFTGFTSLLELDVSVTGASIGFGASALPGQLQALRLRAPDVDLARTDTWSFGSPCGLQSLLFEFEDMPAEWFEALPDTLQELTVRTTDYSRQAVRALTRLSHLRRLTCKGDGPEETLDESDVAVFRQLESLTLDGPGWRIAKHATGQLPRLKHLSCDRSVFDSGEVQKNMPALTSLHVTEAGDYNFACSSGIACMLRMPCLEEVVFPATASEARIVWHSIASAVDVIPGACMWWKPDLSALAEGVKVPEHNEADGEVSDGWYVISTGKEDWYRVDDGLFSCTKPVGTWGVRVRWPKPSQ